MVYVSSGLAEHNPTQVEARLLSQMLLAPEAYDFPSPTEHGRTKRCLYWKFTARGLRFDQSKGSYQQSFVGFDVENKDESRFPVKWPINFDGSAKSASAITPARTAAGNATINTPQSSIPSFSSNPELLKVARKKGTIKSTVPLEENK